MNASPDARGSTAPLNESDSVRGYGAARWKSIGDVPGLTGAQGPLVDQRKLAVKPQGRWVDFWRHGRITGPLSPFVEPVIKALWRNRGTVCLLAIAAFFLIFAEVIIGLCEAVPAKVLDSVVPVGCSAKAENDHHLVYMSCPLLYLPDFRGAVRGSFVENVVAGIDLRGLSIHQQTEIYQWVENAKCESCDGESTDDEGHCLEPSQYTSCKYTFSKAWVQNPVPSRTFHCQAGLARDDPSILHECSFPGKGTPSNVGEIPQALAPFKKKAEDGSVSMGDYPARFYLSSALIEQLPARSTPLFFKNGSLPTMPGYTTTATGDALHEGIRLERNPGSPEPSIGDLRTELSLEDFYGRDDDKFITIVAKQVPWGGTEAPHRQLIPWNSHTRSWRNTSDAEVGWLNVGPRSLNDMIAQRREEEYKEGKKLIIAFRVLGSCFLLFAIFVFGGPLAKIWLGMRHWDTWRSRARDITMLAFLFGTSAIAFFLLVAAFPWLHFQKRLGLYILLAALVTIGISAKLLLRLDTKDNLRRVLTISRSKADLLEADAERRDAEAAEARRLRRLEQGSRGSSRSDSESRPSESRPSASQPSDLSAQRPSQLRRDSDAYQP